MYLKTASTNRIPMRVWYTKIIIRRYWHTTPKTDKSSKSKEDLRNSTNKLGPMNINTSNHLHARLLIMSQWVPIIIWHIDYSLTHSKKIMLIISQSLPPERSEILETKNKHLNNVWVRKKITIYYKKHLEMKNN